MDEAELQGRLTGLGVRLPSPVLDDLRIDQTGRGNDGMDGILGRSPQVEEEVEEVDAIMRAAADEVALDHEYGSRVNGAAIPPPPTDDLSDLAATQELVAA